ncbi:MAG: Ig-like domain-containing protein, partial [Pseudohongiellaceae bacterium]
MNAVAGTLTVTVDAVVVTLPTVTIAADETSVEEGVDATFTITSDTAPGVGETLVVNVGTTEMGTFFMGTPPTSVTIAESTTTAVLTVATEDDGNDEADGSITATITADAAYTVGADMSDSIAVTDNDEPTIDTPTLSIVGGSSVAEGIAASFTITADGVPTNALVVGVTGANATGMFLGTVPATYNLANDASSWTVTVPTQEDSSTDGGTAADGAITLMLDGGTGYMVSTTAGENIGTVTVRDISFITVSYLGKASGTQLCPAAKSGNTDGICEGDTIVYTLTANPAPTSDLSVRIGRLEAGQFNVSYGVTNPHGYNTGNESGNRILTIPTSGSLDYEIPADNEYGGQDDGAYYLEIVCYTNNAADRNTGNTLEPNCAGNVDGHDAEITPYRFVALTRGAADTTNTGAAFTGTCGTRAAGGDGDDASECLVDVRSVTAPAMSIEAGSTSVVGGNTVTFTITGTAEPNYYVSEALAALPVSITVEQGGNALTGAPTAVSVAVGATTADVMITTGADAGTLEVTITDADGYSVGTPASASVEVEAQPANASPTPTLALDDGTNSGSNDDLITNVGSPTFNLGNLVNGATVVVDALNPILATDQRFRKTFTATGTTGSVTFADSDGTTCDFYSRDGSSELSTGEMNCSFTSGVSAGANDGGWVINATQHAPAMDLSLIDTLTVTLDTTAPTVSLGPLSATVTVEETLDITITTNEATADLLDGEVTTDMGMLSALMGSGTDYTTTLTAPAAPGTVTISVGATTFTDTAGNANTAGDTLAVTVEAAPVVPAITLTVTDTSDTAITEVAEGGVVRLVVTSNVMPSADLSVQVRIGQPGFDPASPPSGVSCTIVQGAPPGVYECFTTITIPSAGMSNSFDLQLVDNSDADGDVSVNYTLELIGNTYTIVDPGFIAINHLDDEPAALPTLSIRADKTEVTEGAADAMVVFTVTSTVAPTADLNVFVLQTGEGDWLPVPLQGNRDITIPMNMEMGHLTVTIVDDDVDEADGTLIYTIDTTAGYALDMNATSVTVNVIDNDVPAITVDYASQATGGKTCTATGAAGICEGDA